MRRAIVGAAIVIALTGCAVDDAADSTGTVEGSNGPVPDRTLNVQLGVVDAEGNAVELNHFAAASDVYLTVNAADASKPVTAEEFEFRVIDATGAQLSKDESFCRRFRVDEHGRIVGVTTLCLHPIVQLDKTIIGLAPFDPGTKLTLEMAARSDGEKITVPFVVGG